jgi:hypothetical protein
MRIIQTISEYRQAAHPFRRYAWPGGYPVFAITSDGAALCFDCLKIMRRSILAAIRDRVNDGWRVSAFDINWEDPGLYCEHCGTRIESAYVEDDIATSPAV